MYANIFDEKMWVAFHIFSAKNTCELDIVLTRTANILTTDELVKVRRFEQLGPELYSLTFTFLLANSADDKLVTSVLIFPIRQDLRQFAWNVNSCFVGKIRNFNMSSAENITQSAKHNVTAIYC